MNEDVRGEAARLAERLQLAFDRLGSALPVNSALPAPSDAAGSPGGPVGSAAAGIVRLDDDDEVAGFLRPSADRIAQLLDLAHSLADGTLSPESAEAATRAVADLQPYRRPR